MIVNVDKVIELKPNSMLVKRPELILEWDFEKNNELRLDVYEVSRGMNVKVWWICGLGHEYKCRIGDRANGQGCSYCSNSKTLKGYNDMWTTNPELAKQLLNPEDGYKYTQGSKKKLDWKCIQCSKIIANKMIMQVKNEGLNCSLCSNKIKYPERFMKYLLQYLDISFYHDLVLPWSNNKRYDFYLPEYNLIIETHGGQHYDESGFCGMGGRTLHEEQINDKYKYELAKNNGIENYIVIDCRNSNFNFIKKNTLNSNLGDFINMENVEWELIHNRMRNTKIQNIADDWVMYKDSKKISEMNKTSIKETREILLKATELGYCNYNRKEDLYYDSTRFYQLDTNYEILAEYIQDDENFDTKIFNIDRVKEACREMKKHKGYYWSKKNSYKKNKIKFDKIRKEYIKENSVLQIDISNGDIIKEWEDVHEILNENIDYLQAPLNNSMYGHINSYKGFIWVKTKDYDKNIIKDKINNIKNNKLCATKNRNVLKIDIKTGEILEVFKGAATASRAVGVSENTISKCLKRGKLSSAGFIWIREDDYNTDGGKEHVKYVIKRKIELGDNDGKYGRESHNTKKVKSK